MTGKASWYGKDFHGGPTASGIKYDMYTFTAAHRTLPMGTVVKVTTQDSGKSVMVCVTDRGPYVRGRIIDLSYAAATQLDLRNKGVGDVKLEVVSDSKGAPLKSKQAFFVEYKAARGQQKAGPYKDFSDASAMHEALRQAHPEAKIILADK
ncbi:MAG: septal ring lytic transglycosylase RlpA family protein [Desulfovibrionaceae bacterium]|nr:septal ring lytic transglycosylase RlpA family protein [Desulfovibrionaceae bacterium]